MSQSFVERNKAWLLPLLGLMAIGVIVMNVKMLGKKPAVVPDPPQGAAPAPQASAPPAAPAAPAPAPPPAAPAPPRTAPANGGADLWADLRALEAPAPLLNQKEALLARGADPLKADALTGAPARIALAGRLPRLEEAPLPAVAAATPVAAVSARPVPEVDFLIRNVQGSQAWLEGTGFREGQELAPGWRVKRITGAMVEVEGPGGVVRRFTHTLAASPQDPPRPQDPARPQAPRREVP